jgi:hypothetical protein
MVSEPTRNDIELAEEEEAAIVVPPGVNGVPGVVPTPAVVGSEEGAAG